MGVSLIRLATDDDAAAVAAIYGPVVEGTAISFETEPPDSEEISRRIRDTLMAYPWLVFERNGDVIGYAYASRHRARAAYQWSVDTSAYVDEKFRRRGVGQALYLSLLAVLEAQGFVNAFAGIALPNPASVALHERVGFTPLGVYRGVGYKLGAWRDVGWWQRPLRPTDGAPSATRSPEDVRRSGDWQPLLARGLSVVRAGFSD
jgi:L-amino acid N-acyltransferase YncA